MALVIKSDHVIICKSEGGLGWVTKRGINFKLNFVWKTGCTAFPQSGKHRKKVRKEGKRLKKKLC